VVLLNIHDAKSTLSAVIAEIEEKNETVRICRNGKPVAELVKIPPLPSPLRHSARLGKMTIEYDPAAPLAGDQWPEEQR
jgi:antitoxin (DNA-binding transcriptional repressor) of toxin-antitoxin stability system